MTDYENFFHCRGRELNWQFSFQQAETPLLRMLTPGNFLKRHETRSTFGKALREISAMPEIFRHKHRVTYAECTVGNHIYYGRYLNLLEEARGEFMRAASLTFLQLQEQDTIFPVVEVHLRYKAAARYDDLLTIETWLVMMKGVRLNFAFRILNQENALLVEGETWHVCTSLSDNPKVLP
jgi:acyl-CoA thioester hydrolase